MKRFKVLGLCLVAVFALSALIGTASSSALEYSICAKANPKNTGNYTAKNCEAASKVVGTGKYEVMGYEAAETAKLIKKHAFKGKNVGTPKNIIVNPFGEKAGGPKEPAKTEGSTECLKEKPEGTVTGPKTTTWKTKYQKCIGNGVPCNTTGAKAETIETDQLESTLAQLSPTRVGIRVKGLGPGGRLAQYECPLLKINIEVYGEVLAEQTGNNNITNKKTNAVVKGGPLNLQSDLYENESHTEETGKAYFEWGFAFEACVKEELEKGKTKAEAEGACFGKLGPYPGFPAKPITLISVVSGAINAKAPAVQNGVTENKGEAFMISNP